jgi:hypothetical protein
MFVWAIRSKSLAGPESNGANGFAGTIGVVEEIETKEKFREGNIGSIFMRLPSGAILGGVGVNRLKLKLISREYK